MTPDRLVGEGEDALLGGVGLQAAAVAAGVAGARAVGIDDDVADAAGPAETAGKEPAAGDDAGADPGRDGDVGEVVDAATGAVVRLAEGRRGRVEREVVGASAAPR